MNSMQVLRVLRGVANGFEAVLQPVSNQIPDEDFEASGGSPARVQIPTNHWDAFPTRTQHVSMCLELATISRRYFRKNTNSSCGHRCIPACICWGLHHNRHQSTYCTVTIAPITAPMASASSILIPTIRTARSPKNIKFGT